MFNVSYNYSYIIRILDLNITTPRFFFNYYFHVIFFYSFKKIEYKNHTYTTTV